MADPSGEARTAVERAAAMPPPKSKAKPLPTIGPVRYNFEAFGVAILGAVLLKWFCIEAFQIPTSSMQPTLMGSSEAGVYDRLLVDKLTPVLREPQRWDITVFGYPLQQNQNYVKRLVGLPNETLFIGGGNLYTVDVKDGVRTYHVQRKPDRIQDDLWKEVYPARLALHPQQKVLGEMLYPTPTSAWSATDDPSSLTVQLEPVPGRVFKLSFTDNVDGGFTDRVWDGYPTSTAQAIRDQAGNNYLVEIVPDARIDATFMPDQAIEELALEVEVRRPNLRDLAFAMVVRDGKCQLSVKSGDGRTAESGAKVCELPAGVATRIGFAHVDDELIAYRDGDEVLRFDVASFDCRDGCELADGKGATSDQYARPQLRLKGQGKVQIDDLRICRDLHYTKRQPGFEHARDLIEIPAGHYFMMGDNTLQSIDSRGWTALEVGVLADNTVVPPEVAKATPGARVIRGNKRPMPSSRPPDRDETPVVIASRDMMAMIDEFGDVHPLKAQARVEDGKINIAPPTSPAGAKEWQPPEAWVGFVPREHIRGRALVRFWRWPYPRFAPVR